MLQCAEHGKPQMGTVGAGSVIKGCVPYTIQQLKVLLISLEAANALARRQRLALAVLPML